MGEKLYFATDTIDEIRFDIVISKSGVREILINKKSESFDISEMIQISLEDPKVIKYLCTT